MAPPTKTEDMSEIETRIGRPCLIQQLVKSVNVSTRITETMREDLDKVAKEYNVTRAEMLRTLIAEVVDDDSCTRSYPRRKDR